MAPVTLFYLLDWANTLLALFSVFLIAATLFLYSSYAARHKIPLHAWHTLIPLGCAITGVFTTFYLSPRAFLLCWPLFFFVILCPNRWRLLYVHAVLCCLCASLCLSVCVMRNHTITALLCDRPHTIHATVTDIAPWRRTKKSCRVTLFVSHVDYQPLTGTIRCYLYSTPWLSVGDFICAYKFATSIQKKNDAHYLTAYALRDNVIGSAFLPYLRHKKLTQKLFYKQEGWWHTKRAQLYEQIESILPPPVFTYVSALFFGNKLRPDYPSTKRVFSTWGITHYLARSGLHIALIIMLWGLFLLCLPLPYSAKHILLLLLLGLYTQLSWTSISFMRALWLWLLYAGAFMSRERIQPLYLLSLISLCITLLQPAYVLCIDFQLSFFLTGVLMAYSHKKKREFLLSSCAR